MKTCRSTSIMKWPFLYVHNGVIENYEELKGEYLQGVSFISETDTEVIVQLVEYFSMTKSFSTEEAFTKVLSLLHGSYALGLLDAEDKDTIYVAKNKSPLLLGVGEGSECYAHRRTCNVATDSKIKKSMTMKSLLLKKMKLLLKMQMETL